MNNDNFTYITVWDHLGQKLQIIFFLGHKRCGFVQNRGPLYMKGCGFWETKLLKITGLPLVFDVFSTNGSDWWSCISKLCTF